MITREEPTAYLRFVKRKQPVPPGKDPSIVQDVR